MTVTTMDRIAGGLLGVAAGDALGATVEFLTPDTIAAEYGTHRDIIGGGAFHWEPGEGTDDTDMTWAVVSAYLEGCFSLYGVADEFLEWFSSNPKDIGATTRQALTRLAANRDPDTSGSTQEHSCGNGSLMRALPTALVRPNQMQRQDETARISSITHAHPRCVDACIAYNDLAAALLEGHTPTEAINEANDRGMEPEVRWALRVVPEIPASELSTSGYVIDSLTCAVWAIQQPTSLEETLITLVNRGDDADTTGAIAGGLLGVLQGAEAIPQRWTRQLTYRDRILAAVPRLAHYRGAKTASRPSQSQ